MTKFMTDLNLQICQYWYILCKQKLTWTNQLKTCTNSKAGPLYKNQFNQKKQ